MMKSQLVLLLCCALAHTARAQRLDIEKLDPNMTLEKADASGIAWFDPRDKPFRLTGFEWIEQDKVYRRLPIKPQWGIRKPVDSLANSTAGGQIHLLKVDSDSTAKPTASTPVVATIATPAVRNA